MPSPVRHEKKYTYADYLSWPDEERWEIIEGTPWNMTPAPSTRHQAVLWELAGRLHAYLSGRPCRGFTAPFDVVLPEPGETEDTARTVVQPDLVVVCDRQKLTRQGCVGPPDLIIEIISPSTAQKDRMVKVALYERHQVREYWIVDPVYRMVTARILEADHRYGMPKEYGAGGQLESAVLPGLTIDLDGIFDPSDA